MTDTIQAKGSCLCGKVSFTAKQLSPKVGACHCSMCRKWVGGPLMSVDCASDVSFNDESYITTYDSSDWAERGFCNQCGSHLFYRLKATQQHIMPAGLFDDQSAFIFNHQVFIDEKPSFYCFSNNTHDMTGAEVFAQYAPPE